MEGLAEGDKIVMHGRGGIQFAIMGPCAGKGKKRRVRVPVTYVAYRDVVDPVRSNPVRWYISSVPQWEQTTGRALLNIKTGKIVGNLTTHFVGRYQPDTLYNERTTVCD